MIDLRQGDCLEVMRTLPDNSVHACVTDPPYGLAFMGKKWDYDVPTEDVWHEVLRVLKPGGFLLSFSGTRTYHRMTVRIEDAGFEIRDMIQWIYGSGFPKSHDVSKAIDREAGESPADTGYVPNGKNNTHGKGWGGGRTITAPTGISDAAKQWEGWGTALKPACECVCVARKPLIGTVAQNVLAHGCGGLNIDACRVEGPLEGDPNRFTRTDGGSFAEFSKAPPVVRSEGRWPANVVHDGSDEACTGMGESSRYFYSAKADRAERDKGTGGPPRFAPTMGNGIGGKEHDPMTATPKRNHHPTVKPVDLMRWLVRLVCPPGGVVLDPYTGSGTTGVACRLEGFGFIGIELNPEYIELARQRINAETPSLFTEAIA